MCHLGQIQKFLITDHKGAILKSSEIKKKTKQRSVFKTYIKQTSSSSNNNSKTTVFHPIPRQSVLRKASICSCPTPLAPFWPNSRWESSRCKTSMAISWKPPSWFPPRSASTYDRRRSGSFCFTNCAAGEKKKKQKQNTQVRDIRKPRFDRLIIKICH